MSKKFTKFTLFRLSVNFFSHPLPREKRLVVNFVNFFLQKKENGKNHFSRRGVYEKKFTKFTVTTNYTSRGCELFTKAGEKVHTPRAARYGKAGYSGRRVTL
jgi:hypothetical protein